MVIAVANRRAAIVLLCEKAVQVDYVFGIQHERRQNRISAEIHSALAALLDAYDCAKDTESGLWDFAISICRMYKFGLTETDFRWLVRRGYVEHAREVHAGG